MLAPGVSVQSLRDPGSEIDDQNPTARVGDELFKGSGTSQAAAITSGAVALLLQSRPDLTPDQVKALLTSTDRNAHVPSLKDVGVIDVHHALTAPVPPHATQSFDPAVGTGSLEAARGSSHLVDPISGQQLTGEKDVMGNRFNAALVAADEADGSAWHDGGVFNGSRWTGSRWTDAGWEGSRWTGTSWTGSRWTSYDFSGNSWDGSRWTGSRWTGSRWTGSRWTGSRWTDAGWAGSEWA